MLEESGERGKGNKENKTQTYIKMNKLKYFFIIMDI